MNNKVLVVLLLVFLVVGFFVGNLLTGSDKLKTDSLIGSKIIQGSGLFAVGQITKISNKYITITSEGETLVIPVALDVQVSIIVPDPDKAGNYVPKTANFSAIKVGDNATITIRLKLGGGFEASTISVFPK